MPSGFRDFFDLVTRHPLSLAGTVITTATATVFLSLLGIDAGPYGGILLFLILPALFLFGLLLIPLGNRLYRRRAAAGRGTLRLPVIDLNSERTRKVAVIVVAATMVNVAILALASYKALEFSESNAFCGLTCHSVMAPEYTAHQLSPHARVRCAECHIGEGAGWLVKYKIDGVRQVVAVALDSYARPIASPVHNLRPARDTCEQCHWPSVFTGVKVKSIPHFGDDESNTERWTVLGVRVGGRLGADHFGIHWHVDPETVIRYRSDASRETIYDVEVSRPDGTRDVFYPGGEPAAVPADAGEWRVMDCVDCHNRPTHVYRRPEQEVDGALLAGGIDRSLPYIRREALQALQAPYPSPSAAAEGIETALLDFYGREYPELATGSRERVLAAAQALSAAWARNVFPSMSIGWNTYPDHIGHEQSPGCFRCHDEDHATSEGKAISQDCEMCHTVMALDEESPEILQQVAPELARGVD